MASLLPAFISQDLKSGQQCQQHETDGHCPGKAHTCHSTSWQRARLREKQGFRMSKVEASKRCTWLSSCSISRDLLPRGYKYDVYTLCLSSKGSQGTRANSSTQGTLPKSSLIILEAGGTTNTYLIAQAQNPRVISDSSSSSPQPPSCWFHLHDTSPIHPLVPSPLSPP